MSQDSLITLACTVCQHGNYASSKNKKIKGRLELSKFCKFCRKHAAHKETK